MGSAATAQEGQGNTPGQARPGSGQTGGAQDGSNRPATTPHPTDKSAPGTAGDTKGGSQAFVRTAAIDGMAEVELGRLASQKALSDEVKKFGERMAADHGKANDELKTLAQTKGIALPADLDAKHKQTRDRLSKLSDTAFDRAYMDEMRKDHQKAVDEFQKQSTSGSDPDVKAWAAKTLPVLQEHRQMAERTYGAVATSGAKSSKSGKSATSSTAPRAGSGSSGTTDRAGSDAPGGSASGSGAAPGKDSPPNPGGSGSGGGAGGSSTPAR